jgi:hypothetical protein
MGEDVPEIEQVAAQLFEEITQTHAAFLGVHKFASAGGDPMVQLNCMKVAARLIQAQASAALSFKRLRSEGQHTFTYVHQGGPPTPQKSKTNVPARGDADAQTVHGS